MVSLPIVNTHFFLKKGSAVTSGIPSKLTFVCELKLCVIAISGLIGTCVALSRYEKMCVLHVQKKLSHLQLGSQSDEYG